MGLVWYWTKNHGGAAEARHNTCRKARISRWMVTCVAMAAPLLAGTATAGLTKLEQEKLSRAAAARTAAGMPAHGFESATLEDTPSAVESAEGWRVREVDPASWPAHLGPVPQRGSVSPARLAAALEDAHGNIEGSGSVGTLEEGWENQEAIEAERRQVGERARATGRSGVNDDDDSIHYARGSTLVMHVFVNHSNGSWSQSERDESGVRAAVAKNYWLNSAPAGANLHFDFEGTSNYWYVTANLGFGLTGDDMGSDEMEAALAAMGLSDGDGDGWRVDDYTLALQNQLGGWDNVMVVFQAADVSGRAWASPTFGRTALYPGDPSSVWAHEWGHLFGACDEYIEDGSCNGGVDCGPCQGWYLQTPAFNGNCQLSCGTAGPCLMNASQDGMGNTVPLCSFSRLQASWLDSNGDGVLNTVRRRLLGSSFVDIPQLLPGQDVLSTETVGGWVAHVSDPSWSVCAVRNPPAADYSIQLYGDNNHAYLYASSSANEMVDFVVSDYNHLPPENDHIQIETQVGLSGSYRLEWEAGTESVYADGVIRSDSWAISDVARVYELPLFGGEVIQVTLDPTSQLDLGMALFRSDGGIHRFGRSQAAWQRDGAGAGGAEVIVYAVPEDDVYGLVVWSNGADAGSATLKIGPGATTLQEEVTSQAYTALGLYQYTPNASAWSFLGARPTSGAGDVSLSLFDDSTYSTKLEESESSPGLEFVVADYNHLSWEPEYARVPLLGNSDQQVQWEHHNDLLGGYAGFPWDANDLGKVWDVFLRGGQTYFFRTYESGGNLDAGLHLFYSGNGDLFKAKGDAIASSTSRPPTALGEWFEAQVWVDDWFGLVMAAESGWADVVQLWWGPKTTWFDDEVQHHTNEVVFGTHATLDTDRWAAAGVRASSGGATLSLYGDEGYGEFEASDPHPTPVAVVAMDYNHEFFDQQFLRARDNGTGDLAVEFDGGSDSYVFQPGGAIVESRGWGLGQVVEVFDLYIDGSRVNPQDVVIEVVPTSGPIDLGMGLFKSNDAAYKAGRAAAVASSDTPGEGLAEMLEYDAESEDWYGLVVWNRTEAAGTYLLTIYDPAVTGLPEDPDGLPSPSGAAPNKPVVRVASANPFHARIDFSLGLPSAGPVQMRIHDVSGRLVRDLDRQLPGGWHSVNWDGKDANGQAVPPGVYFARVGMPGLSDVFKVVRR